MPKFNFFDSTGKKFLVETPSGVSEDQARRLFQQQVSTGSLTNLNIGSSLNALTQAASGLTSALSFISPNQINSTVSTLGKLTGLPVGNTLNTANFLKTAGPAQGIGPLDTSQIQGLMAQTSAALNQSAGTVSATTGIGKFGVSPQQLEQQGYLKPGTVSNFLSDANQLNAVLSSPTVWTGKDGIKNLTSFTTDVNKQNILQQNILQNSFQSLSQAGAITAQLPTKEVGVLMQVASKFGTGNAVSWAKGASPASIVNQVNQIAKQGEYALNFVANKLPVATKGEAVAVGYKNTVNRAPVDQAVKSILANNKIPTPNYTVQSATEAATIASQTPNFNLGLNSIISSLGIGVATPGFNPASSGSGGAVSLAKQRNQLIQNLDAARTNYESVLAANNNNRLAPEVQVAFAEFQSALKALDSLG